MAQMDGLEVFRASTETPSPPATILHSAFVDVRTAVTAIRCGIRDVMEKPVPEPALVDRIRELANERRQAPLPSTRPPKDGAVDVLLRLVGDSATLASLREQVRLVSGYKDLPVLVQGATGTGKELVAEAVHALTTPTEPFVSINCAAVPEQLFESELFGHEAGAFTSSRSARPGLLEEAGAGTIFLDEVGEMPLPLQAKLLRVLETRQFRRVGSNRTRLLGARVVSATNRALASASNTSMRRDLYFRLAGYTIFTPSLSEHLEDLPQLTRYFVREFAVRHRVGEPKIEPDSLEVLKSYGWPGNVRELRAVVENACILARGRPIGPATVQKAIAARSSRPSDPNDSLAEPREPVESETRLKPVARAVPRPGDESAAGTLGEFGSLPDLEKGVILRAFESASGNLSMAARELGIPRSTLRDRLRKYGVR
jgi:DNA-binding NtrC family response regulator